MKRNGLHALNPASARWKIAAAKSNKPFMTALLDRGHRGHKDAVEQWTRLHEAAFSEPERSVSSTRGGVGEPHADGGFMNAAFAGLGKQGTESGGGEPQAARRTVGSATERRPAHRVSQKSPSPARSSGRRRKFTQESRSRRPEESLVPDLEQPLDVDPAVISPLLRRPGESETDWLNRVVFDANDPDVSLERLLIIREAILREIGFYDLGSRRSNSGGRLNDADWNVLAILQNIPVDGWRNAQSLGGPLRAEFEKTGMLPFFGVLGPDGKIYDRLTIRGVNPVGSMLRGIDEIIRIKQPRTPNFDAATVLPVLGLTLTARRGGVPSRIPPVASAVPRAFEVIRSGRGTAAVGIAAGVGLGIAGNAARKDSDRAEMDAAPDLPSAPGLEPPEEPDTDESFDEASIEIETVPGLEFPEPNGPMVLIFPNISDEIEQILINDIRRERQETKDQLDAIRDHVLASRPDWKHIAGGRNAETGLQMTEHRFPGPGSAFRHPVTGRPGDGRPGSTFADLTFETPDGKLVHIQTVDVDRHGAPSDDELRAARRIARAFHEPVYVILKTWQLRGGR